MSRLVGAAVVLLARFALIAGSIALTGSVARGLVLGLLVERVASGLVLEHLSAQRRLVVAIRFRGEGWRFIHGRAEDVQS